MRTLLLALTALASSAQAQAISGTLTATFLDFNEFGGTNTRLTLNLACGLSCDASAPELRYRVAGGVQAWFAAAPTENTGYIGSGFGSAADGQNSYVSEQFEPGTAFIVKAKSASCHCGNRIGEGGYIDLESQIVAIAPWLTPGSAKVGDEYSSIIVSAQPRGGDQLVVRLQGGGLDETRTLAQADFGTQKSVFVRFTPTQPGTLTYTATLQPYGVSRTGTLTVADRSGSSSGGGTGGSGGGSGGGDQEPEPSGCGTAPLAPLLALSLALARARRHR